MTLNLIAAHNQLTNPGNASTNTIVVPAGVTSAHFAVVMFASASTYTNGFTPQIAGFTTRVSNPSQANNSEVTILTRLGGMQAGDTLTVTAAINRQCYAYMAWYDTAGQDVEIVGSVGGRSGTTSQFTTIPSLTTVSDNQSVIVLATERTTATGTVIEGWSPFTPTQDLYIEETLAGTGTSGYIGHFTQSTAGPTGNLVADYNGGSGNGAGVMFAFTTPPTSGTRPADEYGSMLFDDGPVAYYRFGGDVADVMGGPPGVLNNTATYGPGLLAEVDESGLLLTGSSNDFATVPNSLSGTTSAPFSLETWFKGVDLPIAGGFQSVISTISVGIELLGTDDGPVIRAYTDYYNNTATTALTVTAEAVYHAVSVYNGAELRLFVNGVEVAAVATTIGSASSELSMFVGSWDGFNDFFDGTIDEVAVYDRALTDTEITEHYQAGAAAATPATTSAVWQSEPGTTSLSVGWIIQGATTARGFWQPVGGGDLTYAASITPPASGWVNFRFTGLAPDTVYNVGIEANGEILADGWGQYRTLTTATKASKVIASSCNVTGSTHAVFTRIKDEAPDFFAHMGDLHYADLTTYNDTSWRNAFASTISSSTFAPMLASVPMVYDPDNHDGPGTSLGFPNGIWDNAVSTAVRDLTGEIYESPTKGFYKTWVHAGVRYIELDRWSFRSDPALAESSSKTMLGAAQKTWFLNLLQNASEQAIVVLAGFPNYSNLVASGRWGSYSTERVEIGNVIAALPADQKDKIVFIGGDSHSVMADDGTNAMWGCPSLNASPLNQSGGLASGVWNIANIDVDDTRGYFSRLTFTPNGSDLDFTWDAVQDDGTVMATWSKTFVGSAEPASRAAFRSASSAHGAGTSIVVAKPEGATVGDVLYAFQVSDDSQPAAPTGDWTQIFTGGDFGRWTTVWRRVVDNTEAADFTFNYSGHADTAASIICVSGADPMAPESVLVNFTTGTGASMSAPSVTPTITGGLLISSWTLRSGSTGMTVTPPGTMTERVDTGGDWVALSVATEELNSTSPTGTRTATASGEPAVWLGVSLVVVPVAVEQPTGPWYLWDGIQEIALTFAGVWNGTSIVESSYELSPDAEIQQLALVKGPWYNDTSATYSTSTGTGPTGLDVARGTNINADQGWGCFLAANTSTTIPAGTSVTITWWMRSSADNLFYNLQVCTDPASAYVSPTNPTYSSEIEWTKYTWTFTTAIDWVPVIHKFRTQVNTALDSWVELSDVQVSYLP